VPKMQEETCNPQVCAVDCVVGWACWCVCVRVCTPVLSRIECSRRFGVCGLDPSTLRKRARAPLPSSRKKEKENLEHENVVISSFPHFQTFAF
jgi:hypothetical protein